MFGDARTQNGKPVMISMLLHPETKTGEVLDYGVVTSAYGRRINNAQNLINSSNVRYIDEDKGRTGNWSKALGLQLPSASTNQSGSVYTVSQPGEKSNNNSSPKSGNASVEVQKDAFAQAEEELLESDSGRAGLETDNKKPPSDNGGRYAAENVTQADINAVQSIGRKSVNSFSKQDIKTTERYARAYYKLMGVKSPFFRAWFGDWRANDQSPVTAANQQGSARGVQRNEDTKWDINVSGQVFNETQSHNSIAVKAARPYLPYINDIVRNAILLDSFAMGTSKYQNSLMMHSMYAVADVGYEKELLKLYVEEMNDPNSKDTTKRAYQLQNIEGQQVGAKGSGKSPSLVTQTAGIKNVSDLFAAVKAHDADFQPKPCSLVTNPDGTRYVRADRKLLAGEKPENWEKQLEAYINEKIRFDEIVDADGYRFNVEKEEATDPMADHTAGSDDNGTPVTSSKDSLPQTAANSKENPSFPGGGFCPAAGRARDATPRNRGAGERIGWREPGSERSSFPMPEKTILTAAEEQTCPAVGYQSATVCVPVTVIPYASAGETYTRCCGTPVVTAGQNTCGGTKNGTCVFTISQDLCMEVPVVFGATAEVGSTYVTCNGASAEDICTDCGEVTPEA